MAHVATIPGLSSDFLDRLVSSITEAIPTEFIYVFGSYARGDFTPESDIDIYVGTNSDRSRYDDMADCRRALAWLTYFSAQGLPRGKDVLCAPAKDFECNSRNLAAIEAVIRLEGVKIYDRLEETRLDGKAGQMIERGKNPNLDGYMYSAVKDIYAIRALAEDSIDIHCEAIAFHCQQAAEKLLKNVFLCNGEVPPKTHVLDDLLGAAVKNGWMKTNPEAILASGRLTNYAVAARYAQMVDISGAEARLAMKECDLIAQNIRDCGYDSVLISDDDPRSIVLEECHSDFTFRRSE